MITKNQTTVTHSTREPSERLPRMSCRATRPSYPATSRSADGRLVYFFLGQVLDVQNIEDMMDAAPYGSSSASETIWFQMASAATLDPAALR